MAKVASIISDTDHLMTVGMVSWMLPFTFGNG